MEVLIMKNVSKLLGGIALIIVIVFSMTACGSPGGGGDDDKDLPGTITISPIANVKTGTELTATYAPGDETITDWTWQWKRGDTNVGTDSNKYTPRDSGSYTVTVSVEGYKPKKSSSVYVSQDNPPPSPLAGTISISPAGPVETGTKLTATYTPETGGSSSGLSYRWENNGDSAGSYGSYTGSPIEFTPTKAGIYTITVTRTSEGRSKTSDPVIVRTPGKQLTRQKWYEIYNEIRYAGLEDGLLDLSEYTRSDNADENPGLNSNGDLFLSYDDFGDDKPKLKIKKIILPKAAVSLKKGTSSFNDLRSFDNLEEISGANITAIDKDVFSWLKNLTTVDFPNVETIGDNAFRNTPLTEIDFPKATFIDVQAFANCEELVTVNLPKAATIGISAFSGCTSLKTVDFPEAATIGNSAFYDCTSLVTVALPEAAAIGTKIFENCSSLEEVTLGKITSIGMNVFTYGNIETGDAFYGAGGLANLKTVSLPEVTTINRNAFYECKKLESVNIPKVTSVARYAFYNCEKLKSASFPDLTTVDDDAFQECTSLASVNFPKVTEFKFGTFRECTSLENAEFPELLKLGGYTFNGCTNLKSVALPKVTDLANNAFESCTSLETIVMGATAPIIGHFSFAKITTAQTVTVKIPNGATGYSPAGTYNDQDTIEINTNWANGLRGCGWEDGKFTLVPGFNAQYYLNKNITIIIEKEEA
jgi:hypothetical protein